MTYDSTYGTLPTPTRTGYTFAGWWTAASNGTQITSSTKVAITTAQTLYAHWTANTYTVTLNSNDGTYLSKTSLTIAASETGNWNYQSVSSGVFAPNTTYVLKIGTATRTAGSATNFQVRIYDFTTNAERATATAAFGSNVSITLKTSSSLVPANNNQIIIYAGVSGSTAGVAATFNNISLTVAKTVTFDSTYGDLPNPTRAGYTFAGWWTAASNGTQITSSTKVAITAAQTLYAHWTGNEYTLSFAQNGGSGGALSSANYTTSPSDQTITVTEPTRNGWTRTSWTIAGYTGTAPSISGTTLTIPANTYGNITVTPVWTGKTYTITWSANGGTGGKVSKTSYTVSASSQTVTITAPTRNGYSVSGYSVTGNSGTATISGTTLTIAANTYGNLTVKANWTAKTYSVSSGKNRGTLTVSSSGTYGSGLSIKWSLPATTAQYYYTLGSVKVYSGTSTSGTLLATYTSGTSATYTMNGAYYSNIYVYLTINQNDRIYTLTITSSSSTWSNGSGTLLWVSIGANSSVNLTRNTSLTFTAKYGQEVWMNLETRGFDVNFNRVDWSITPTSLLTVKSSSGSNNAKSFSAGDGSGGYLRGKSTAAVHSTAWIRWEFKPTASTSTSSSCCTITIHNYKN